MRHLRDQHKFYKVVRYGTFWPKLQQVAPLFCAGYWTRRQWSKLTVTWAHRLILSSTRDQRFQRAGSDEAAVVKVGCELGPQTNFVKIQKVKIGDVAPTCSKPSTFSSLNFPAFQP